VLSSGEVVVAFLCASSSDVRISLECVLISVMKLTNVGVMCLIVCWELCALFGCWYVGVCLDAFPDCVMCRARLSRIRTNSYLTSCVILLIGDCSLFVQQVSPFTSGNHSHRLPLLSVYDTSEMVSTQLFSSREIETEEISYYYTVCMNSNSVWVKNNMCNYGLLVLVPIILLVDAVVLQCLN
jgi:hypothetical protein